MRLQGVKRMTSYFLSFFRGSGSDSYDFGQTQNDEAVDILAGMSQQNEEPSQPPTSNMAVDVGACWRTSSLSSKYNTLLAELDANRASQKGVTDTQILYQLKAREIAIVTEIYYIETTLLRMELSNLGNGKI